MNIIPLVLQIAALVFFALAFFRAFPKYDWFAGSWGLLLLSVMLAGSVSIPLHTVGGAH
jgi:hypothetical protein